MDYRSDFPIFSKRPNLVYLDSAATAQKPQVVLTAITDFYSHTNSNIHRGPNFLAEEATIKYEDARRTVADFVHANATHEIIFTRNATESINLVARSLGEAMNEDDEILLSKLEHHSNIVPWLQLKERKSVNINFIEIDGSGQLRFDPSLISSKTKLVSITGMSNSLGTIPDLKPIIETAHKAGALVLVDLAQLIVHAPVNVQELDADFMVFSGHKIYGPTGVGVLWGREKLLNKMPPFLGGGDMINEVFTDRFTSAGLPSKFEAGTPNIAGTVGLKAALDYVTKVGYDSIASLERELTIYALAKLNELPYVHIIGSNGIQNRGSVISFGIEGVHPHDVAEGLSQKNVCVRAGHHCTQVLMDQLSLPGTARISLALYNNEQDIDRAVSAIREVYKFFK